MAGGAATGDAGHRPACASITAASRSEGRTVPSDVEQQSRGGHVHQQRRAAEGDERQRHAGDRQHADDRADVDERLDDDPRGDAGGQQHAEPVGRAQRRPDAEHAEGDEQRDDQEGADQTELLADDGEDEVGVGVGQEAPLGAARAQADADQPAVAEPTSDWMVW